MNLINSIGYYGPQLLFFASIYFLFNKRTSLLVYFVGFFLNILLNIILKLIIKQPRPSEDKRLFNLELLNGKQIGYDRYGMPSGHAECVFYSTAFIFLTLKNKWIGAVYLIVSLVTSYQRISNNYHTFVQVFIGGLIGILMGYFFYYYSTKILKGSLRGKPDDNAPY